MEYDQKEVEQALAFHVQGDICWPMRDYPEDIQWIRTTLSQIGVNLSALEAVEFWEWHSEKMDAGWLRIINTEYIRTCFQEFFELNRQS